MTTLVIDPSRPNPSVEICVTNNYKTARGISYRSEMVFIWLLLVPLFRNILHESGHPHTPTIICDEPNIIIPNNTGKLRCPKAKDMRFHCIRDCIEQSQFILNLASGSSTLADLNKKKPLWFISPSKKNKIFATPSTLIFPLPTLEFDQCLGLAGLQRLGRWSSCHRRRQ